MVARCTTVAFEGTDVLDIDVQVQMSSGLPKFNLVGLPDKAVAESRERVRAALFALGLSLPAKHIAVNLAPADVLKEGSHFDLPIALALLAAMGVLPAEEIARYTALGELALDGALTSVAGVLPAAVNANAAGRGVICPEKNGGEAVWAGEVEVLAAPSLLALINHFKGTQVLGRPEARVQAEEAGAFADLRDIKGQEVAKRALEVAAAGGHNLLMIGPPGSGKSMLAARLPGILPPLGADEALDVSMIHSLAGLLDEGKLLRRRPFRDPHHSASLPSLVGGGMKAKPGEISLAHNGVLFLDELPEFQRGTLEALRQPLETGRAVVSRANHHVTYPARVQLIAAMNPCRCGYLDDPSRTCGRAPKCAGDYQARISGPLFDRIDCHVEVPAVSASDLSLPPPREDSATVAARVAEARGIQLARYKSANEAKGGVPVRTNAEADGELLEQVAAPDDAGRKLLTQAAEQMKLSARGYHRVLRVARTLADLAGVEGVQRVHVAEALSYRRLNLGEIAGIGRFRALAGAAREGVYKTVPFFRSFPMSLRAQINDALKTAMLGKDERGVATLRMVNAKMKDLDIAARPKGNADGIKDDEIASMMQSMIKQRRESIVLYEKGNRADLVKQESEEIAIIEKFLPKQMDEAAMQHAIDNIVAVLGVKDVKDMGKVMGELKKAYAGKMDFSLAGPLVKAKLSGG